MRERERENCKMSMHNKIVENDVGFLLLFLATWAQNGTPLVCYSILPTYEIFRLLSFEILVDF